MDTATQDKKSDQLFGNKSSINLKDASSRYSTKRYEAKHHSLGRVMNPATGRPAELPSQLDNAKSGALIKHLAQKSGINVHMSDAERALLDESAHCDEWVGNIDGQHKMVAGGSHVKALLDDGTSGGLEIAPITFDSNIITFPLLHGEVFPRVDVVDLSRGRRVEGASIDNVTVSWTASADGETVALFDTSGPMVSAIDTTIFEVGMSIELGRDFLSDAAVDVGAIVTRLIGERLANELDKVIVNGSGSGEPQGIKNGSPVSVSSVNGTGGPWKLTDMSGLLFGIGAQYKNPRNIYISNYTTFQRLREVVVGSGDARPLISGGDVDSGFHRQRTLGFDHAIETNLANGGCIYGDPMKYRLYRRAGLEIRFIDGGKTLARTNQVLLVARARYGGQIVDASAFSYISDGQS